MSTEKLILRNKCVVLGNAHVGKSALVQMFYSDGSQFPKNYAMTLQPEILVKVVNIPETHVSVELYLVDMPGHDTLQEYFSKNVQGANAFVLVYDVTNADSFKALPKWISMIKKSRSIKGPIAGLLLANKIDQTTRRVVSTAQGEEFAKQNGLGFFECSAMNNLEVDSPFYYISSTFHENFEEHLKAFMRAGEAASS